MKLQLDDNENIQKVSYRKKRKYKIKGFRFIFIVVIFIILLLFFCYKFTEYKIDSNNQKLKRRNFKNLQLRITLNKGDYIPRDKRVIQKEKLISYEIVSYKAIEIIVRSFEYLLNEETLNCLEHRISLFLSLNQEPLAIDVYKSCIFPLNFELIYHDRKNFVFSVLPFYSGSEELYTFKRYSLTDNLELAPSDTKLVENINSIDCKQIARIYCSKIVNYKYIDDNGKEDTIKVFYAITEYGHVSERVPIKNIAEDLLKAIAYLHQMNISHGKIGIGSVFQYPDTSSSTKRITKLSTIGKFAYANIPKLKKYEKQITEKSPSLAFFESKLTLLQKDIFQYGAYLYFLIVEKNRRKIKNYHLSTYIDFIINFKKGESLYYPDETPAELKDLIEICLSESNTLKDAHILLNHPYFTNDSEHI